RGLFAGQGLLLRYSWGTPAFGRHLWRQKLYLAALAWVALGAALALAAVLGRGARALAAWAVLSALAWAAMAVKKRSLAVGGLAVLTWVALGVGIVRAWATGRSGATS